MWFTVYVDTLKIAFLTAGAYDPRMSRPNVPPGPSHPVKPAPQYAQSMLRQRPIFPDGTAKLPIVRLRSVRRHPNLFRKMVASADRTAGPGDFVQVLSPQDEIIGFGFYNPMAEIAVRMVSFGPTPPEESLVVARLDRAIALRRDILRLDDKATAYRVIHAEADGFPGLVVDRYGDILSAEAFSLAMYQRAEAILALIAARLGTKHTVIQAPAKTHGQEGFTAPPLKSENCPQSTIITEFETQFRVDFTEGHKTGFFCDQRDNRKRLADLTPGRTVLDVCCYTGGFALQAARLGQAAEVTAVDLDEQALETARQNAKLNRANIKFVHVDAFQYLRDMISNGTKFDVVVLDPPKLIRNRAEIDAGTKKHLDLNKLAMQVVAPGGILVTCSCSGLLPEAEFLRLLQSAAKYAGAGKSIQILERTGASADHPVLGDVPESEYLHTAWLRVLE